MQETKQEIFEWAVRTLFLLGQLPVVAVSFLSVVGVKQFYEGTDWPDGFIASGFLAVLACGTAMGLRFHQRVSILFLVVSLIITFWYLIEVTSITGGRHSPYIHLFLYIPAIVVMVTLRRRWAEILASLGVIVSYMIVLYRPQHWDPWHQFENSSYFVYYELCAISTFLVCLILVNQSMEYLIKNQGQLEVKSELPES